MSDDTSTPGGEATPASAPRPSSAGGESPGARRRSSPLGLAAAVASVAVLAAGGAVALAAGGGADEPSATAAAVSHDDGHDHTDTTAPAGDADPAGTGMGTGEDVPGGPARPGGSGAGHHRDHPPLPPYEQRRVEADESERAAADELLAEVTATLAAYENVDAAVAAGYQARARTARGPLTHYLNRAAVTDGAVLDPARPEGLVYYRGGDGDPVLLGAFFVAPPGSTPPSAAGDLVVWHSHDPACAGFFATEAEPCTGSRRMVHAWTVDQVELQSRRTGEPVAVRITDPFGAPFRASVERVG